MTEKIVTYCDIQACVDRELSDEEAKAVRARIQSDHDARRYYEQVLLQNNMLKRWWNAKMQSGHHNS